MIYLGLLRANPEYLSIAFVALGEDAKEVVRVERNRFDRTSINTVAVARLKALAIDAPSRGVAPLNPGDVTLSELVAADGGHQAAADPSGTRPLTLHLATPVFDETTGELFGAVRLDVDLEYLLAVWCGTRRPRTSCWPTGSAGSWRFSNPMPVAISIGTRTLLARSSPRSSWRVARRSSKCPPTTGIRAVCSPSRFRSIHAGLKTLSYWLFAVIDRSPEVSQKPLVHAIGSDVRCVAILHAI